MGKAVRRLAGAGERRGGSLLRANDEPAPPPRAWPCRRSGASRSRARPARGSTGASRLGQRFARGLDRGAEPIAATATWSPPAIKVRGSKAESRARQGGEELGDAVAAVAPGQPGAAPSRPGRTRPPARAGRGSPGCRRARRRRRSPARWLMLSMAATYARHRAARIGQMAYSAASPCSAAYIAAPARVRRSTWRRRGRRGAGRCAARPRARAAICLLVRPRASRSRTSTSRSVSPAGHAGARRRARPRRARARPRRGHSPRRPGSSAAAASRESARPVRALGGQRA